MGAHIPIRECICCRKKCEKQELLRVAKYNDDFFIDEKHKGTGRGAYICKSCVSNESNLKRRPIDRAFHTRVPDDIYSALQNAGKEVIKGE